MASREATDPGEWVDRYGNDLYRYALVRVRNPEVAEELVQETFLAALKGRKSFSGRSSEKTWLIGILKHKIVDAYRKSSREKALGKGEEDEDDPAEALFDANGHWKESPVSWGGDPKNLVEQQEFREVLDRCLEGLPDRMARAFFLREMEALETEEIRKDLGVTTTNLGVILHRARARLRHCLERNWFGGRAG
ncbi:MAG: sigma-70 family RNA polymerase sigma factor [Planctomycetota bacterium]|jgi:RNA polymerase sigma-70 factor (ECF subfamily)